MVLETVFTMRSWGLILSKSYSLIIMKHLFFQKNLCVWQIEHEAHIVILRGHQHGNLNQTFALISRTGR